MAVSLGGAAVPEPVKEAAEVPDVRDYLAQYLERQQYIDKLSERLSALQSQCHRITTVIREDGGRAKNVGGPKDGPLAELADAKTHYQEEVSKSLQVMADVENFILGKVKKPEHRNILSAIYLDGVKVKDLPAVMGRNLTWCKRAKRNALKEAQSIYKEGTGKPVP